MYKQEYINCGSEVTSPHYIWYGNVLFDIIEYAMPENRFR